MIEPENIASIRLVERLGFRPEGRLQDRLLIAGTYRTVVIYAFLAGQRVVTESVAMAITGHKTARSTVAPGS